MLIVVWTDSTIHKSALIAKFRINTQPAVRGHAACVATSVESVVGSNFRSTGVVC